ncbi:hypothetical protein [Candidatus Spongiihabitans sp.]|uniref:hypothetical protein n=1 Tax=Candidatus Spongiihabitans sp. TaxID=3101308 RepID=UPI003C6EE70B
MDSILGQSDTESGGFDNPYGDNPDDFDSANAVDSPSGDPAVDSEQNNDNDGGGGGPPGDGTDGRGGGPGSGPGALLEAQAAAAASRLCWTWTAMGWS